MSRDIRNVEPNFDADPLELNSTNVRPGNSVTRMSDGKPIFRVIDVQDDSGGDGYPPGAIVRFLDNDSLSFIHAEKLDHWLSTGEYLI